MTKEVVYDEKALIIRLKNDDMAAFDQIYHKYNRLLYGFAIKIVKFNHDAEDIVHDVFLKLWQNRKSIKEDTSFKSFLFTIAYHTIVNLIRKKSVTEEYIEALKDIQKEPPAVSGADLEIEFNELNEKLRNVLEKLPSRQKEVYQLSRDEGLTYSEIAEKLDISVNTVENHMTRALKYLRNQLGTSPAISFIFFCLFI
jgi:RNA polymerase sigma-70 factor (ECF subfamily)